MIKHGVDFKGTIRICETCGKQFRDTNDRQRRCSTCKKEKRVVPMTKNKPLPKDYIEKQKQQTIAMYARVKIGDSND